jgi:phosphoribosylformylglycinamidine synthase
MVVSCPIAHGEGNFFADPRTLAELEEQKQVVFRYCTEDGSVNPDDRESNPNGSLHAIAGICNREGNVVGLMPHPERALEAVVGGPSGDRCRMLLHIYAKAVFESWAVPY